MTTLVIEDKIENFIHEFKLELQRRYQIAGFYPYLYLIGNPSGTFTFKINNGARDVFTKSFNASDIREVMSAPLGAIRVSFPVVPFTPMIINTGNYTARIEASDYSPNSNSYLGWIREHENLSNEVPDQDGKAISNPCTMKIKEYVLGAMS